MIQWYNKKYKYNKSRSRIIDLFSAGLTYFEIAADVRADIKTVKNTVTRRINTGERYVWDKIARPSM